MIRNERQYKITKAEAAKFQDAVLAAKNAFPRPGVNPLILQAEVDGLQSQLDEMLEDLKTYEDIRSGAYPIPSVQSVQDIPRALIQSRIRAGLTQEELAERSGLKPQQIQKYEASDYASASLSRVAEIAQVLDISLEASHALVPGFKLASMMKRLKSAGLPPQFVSNRLLPKRSFGLLQDKDSFTLEAAQAIERVYGWHPGVLLGGEGLDVSRVASTQARFKVPAKVNGLQLGAYVVYAHYLALLLLQATSASLKRLSSDPVEVRRSILEAYGAITFDSVLRFVWSCGIPVLTLNDRGTFHGACWRHGGRNVIVLKQQTRSAARWVFDLLHEYFHAAHNPQLEEHPVVEEAENSESRRKSLEEIAASSFAGNVMLDNRADKLAQLCVESANGSVERLKDATVKVANSESVDVGALAQYMAFRLSAQGVNWWGAATNLQAPVDSPASLPRELLLQNADLTKLNPVDRGLLLRSLEPQIIAFTGQRGSGKTTISEGVAKVLNWPRASFGDYLRAAAKRQGVGDATENLQELGATLAQEPDRFCDAVLTFSKWEAGEPLVVEGIRHQEILDSLRRKVAPLEVRLVYLELGEMERLRRLAEREFSTDERIRAVESHSTESQVKDVLFDAADFRVSTETSTEVVVDKIVDWIQSGNASAFEER
jgi:transcriptional regulator with XRE-family HTH domain/cytidylate kinase